LKKPRVAAWVVWESLEDSREVTKEKTERFRVEKGI